MYNWRKMGDEQRQYVLKNRQTQKHPWHSPKHIQSNKKRFHIVAACYEHKPIIGYTPETKIKRTPIGKVWSDWEVAGELIDYDKEVSVELLLKNVR